MTTTYNRITNKYSFTRIYAQTTNYYYMYSYPVNSGNFFGLNNNVETLISTSGNESTYPININTKTITGVFFIYIMLR
mgnify:CR=1 FL=1